MSIRPMTLYEKLWYEHLVFNDSGNLPILYIDLHLIHEVTSPQAFEGLREKGRKLRKPERTFAVMDHVVPTINRDTPLEDLDAARQLDQLHANCLEHGINLIDLAHPDQGIVHVIAPELGWVRPGMTVVCGDSHTCTLGAFGALSFGIGTSDIEHVLATQCIRMPKLLTMEIRVEGKLPQGVTSKDLLLYLIRKYGTDFGRGYAIEFTGSTFEKMSMDARMTACNMAIELGATVGLVAPDEKTFAYLRASHRIDDSTAYSECIKEWSHWKTDHGAIYDQTIRLDAGQIEPQVTWGTSPGMTIGVSECVPDPSQMEIPVERQAAEAALHYMAVSAGTPIEDILLDSVFLGSCSNSRLEDLQLAAAVVKGYKVAPNVRAIVVPGSKKIKTDAESEGLDRIFIDAGFEWREPGCSMCVGINNDFLNVGKRCASTSNRNFEGRQGPGGRTHLVSPAMAAASAIAGHFVDIRQWYYR
ncbi:3-isopropylmalate dehydratase large subunit [compost metagenome]